MKKVVALILAAIMVFGIVSLTGCGEKKTGVEKIKAAGKLVIYTEAGFAPYEFLYNNEIVGVDIAVMEKVAEKLEVELEVVDVNFNTIIGAVQAGKADIGAAGITIRDDRKKNVDFSIPYSSTEQYVIVPSSADIPTVEGLNGQTIGVQLGTTTDSMLEDLQKDGTLKDSKFIQYNTPALAAAAIPAKVSAVVTDKLTSQIIVDASNGTLKNEKLLKADGTPVADIEEYGYAVAKGNEDLLAVVNEVVQELLDDGSIDKWTSEFSEKAP